jgi:poly(ADP-ribose) glycohydrolase ARH3
VPTALASFALTPDSYADAVANVIFLGGDTDTLAAMAGALSGAYLGEQGVPPRLLGLLEDGPKGRRYLAGLADGLCARYLATRGGPPGAGAARESASR